MSKKLVLSLVTMVSSLVFCRGLSNTYSFAFVKPEDLLNEDIQQLGVKDRDPYNEAEKYLITHLRDDGVLHEIISDLTARVVNKIKAKNSIYDLKKINSKSCLKAVSSYVKEYIDAEISEENSSSEVQMNLWLEGKKSIQGLISKWKKDGIYEKKILQIAEPYASELQKNITEQVRENNNIMKGKRKEEIKKKIKKLSKNVVDKQK